MDDIHARLDALRSELQQADRLLIEALARRHRIVETIGALKDHSQLALRDRAREHEVFARAESAAREERLDPAFVVGLFREIIDHSVRTQEARLLHRLAADHERSLLVGYQGTEGSYGQQAAARHFSPWHAQTALRAFPTFRQLLQAVRARDIDYGVLPIENTTAGGVSEAYDLLAEFDLSIVGEEIQPVDHCLIGIADIDVRELRRVYSHPQALAQCSDFLSRMPWCTPEDFSNTALAVRKVAADGDPAQAAIASEQAARLHGLPVLARDIANRKDNYTRFVIIATDAIDPDPRIPCKTSVLFVTRHERGALVTCLNALADRELNLTRIESRPRPGSPWEYQFYVDIEGHRRDPRMQDALHTLAARAFLLKIFGSYPARTTDDARVRFEGTRSAHP